MKRDIENSFTELKTILQFRTLFLQILVETAPIW